MKCVKGMPFSSMLGLGSGVWSEEVHANSQENIYITARAGILGLGKVSRCRVGMKGSSSTQASVSWFPVRY